MRAKLLKEKAWVLNSEPFCVISFIHIHSFVLFQITWPKLIQKLNPRTIELDSQRPLLKSDSWTNNDAIFTF